MSVLIKGMKMPKSCADCPLLIAPFNVVVCGITRQMPTYTLSETLRDALNKRMSGCPLEEVEECSR